MADVEKPAVAGQKARHDAVKAAAEGKGLLGAKQRQMAGRFSDALIAEAKRVSGFSENTELLTYALSKVALEDDFGERLLARAGRVPKGTFFAG